MGNAAREYVESAESRFLAGLLVARRPAPTPAMADVIVGAMTTVALANLREGWTREQMSECSDRIMAWLMDRYGPLAVAPLVGRATRRVGEEIDAMKGNVESAR